MKINGNVVHVLSVVLITLFVFDAEMAEAELLEGAVGSSLYGVEREIVPGTTFGPVTNRVDVDNPGGAVDYNLLQSPLTTYNNNYNLSGSTIRGFADPGVEEFGTYDAGAYAEARGDRQSYVSSRFGNRFTVEAGDSGLSLGDATTLTVDFRLDGFSYSRGSFGNSYSSVTNVLSGFRLWDPTIEVPAEVGYESPYLINFDAYIWDAEEGFSGSFNGLYDWYWSVDTWSGSYSWNSLYDTPLSDSGNMSYDFGSDYTSSCNASASNPNCNNYFDTGVLSIDINTYVGAELYYYGWLNVGTYAEGLSVARGGFDNTFGGSVTPGAPGIELSFLLAPPQGSSGGTAVPEPSTLLLLGSGLAGLGYVRRRLKK